MAKTGSPVEPRVVAISLLVMCSTFISLNGNALIGPRGRHFSWWYRRSVAGELAVPEGLPLAFFATVEGAEVADGIGSVLPPTHAG